VRAVNDALRSGPPQNCPAADANSNGTVEIDELVDAVAAALSGCAH
jgi:hypothetical protein